MKARDVMGTHVITVGPDQDIAAVADILVRHKISALPVVELDTGRLIGIISEGDLVRRVESGTQRSNSWFLELFTSPQQLSTDFVRSHARKVRDVMTKNVVTAKPETPLRDIAQLLEKHGIKRVPIMSDGRLVGIVSRSNLVQALASRSGGLVNVEVGDEKLRDAVVDNLRKQPGNATMVTVIAEGGVVSLWGLVSNEEERKAIRVAAEITPGVRAVNDNLKVQSYPMAV